MVYKAIKKNRTRRQYEHLSSGAAQSYNISDFYVTDHGGIMNYTSSPMLTTTKTTTQIQNNTKSGSHRRHNSMGEYAFGSFSMPEINRVRLEEPDIIAKTPPKRARLVRFRSHRMFACVGGTA